MTAKDTGWAGCSYAVHEHRYGRYVTGSVPLADISALLSAWEKHGMKSLAKGVASALGAVFAAVRSEEDALAWEAELAALCSHKGIGLPGCQTCDPRTKAEGGPREDKKPVDAVLTATRWLRGNDTGLSSKALLLWLEPGIPVDAFPAAVPCDAADWGRCRRMLALVPEWEERFRLLPPANPPEWRRLSRAWDRLEAAGTGPFDAFNKIVKEVLRG